MAYPKLKTTKRDVTAKELAKRFGCSTRTVFRAWSQSRADYLAENSISRDKPPLAFPCAIAANRFVFWVVSVDFPPFPEYET